MHKPVNLMSERYRLTHLLRLQQEGLLRVLQPDRVTTRASIELATYGLKVPEIVRRTRPDRVQHGSAHHAFGAKTPPNRCRYSSDPSHGIESRTKMVSP